MSTPGHSSESPTRNDRKIASRLLPSLKNRNVVRGASFIFISCLAVGYSLVPAPAFASKAKLTIEPSKSNTVIYVKGAHFPSRSMATVQTTVGGSKEERKVEVRDGSFRLAFARKSAAQKDLVSAKAWSHNIKATAKRNVAASPSTDQKPATVDGFVPAATPETTSTTDVIPAPNNVPPTRASTSSSTTSTTAKTASVSATSTGVPAGYNLAFSDEFDGSSFNQSKWGAYEGVGNAGIGRRVTSAVTQGNGELTITGNGMNGGGFASDYTSTYGYYEVRSRFDANSTGYNTATLLWPTSENWPVDGEIDVSEIFNGDTSNAGSFVHWGSGNQQLYSENTGDFSQWHTWAVDWQPDHLTYYLDGKAYWTVTNAAAIPHNPHFLGMQLDVTSDSNKANGSAFHIDYVRVYQKG